MTARLGNNVVFISTIAASLGRRVVCRQATRRVHVLARRRAVTIATFLDVGIEPELTTTIGRVAEIWDHVLRHDAPSTAGLQQRILDEFSWATSGSEVDVGFVFTMGSGCIRTGSPGSSCSAPPRPSVSSFPSSPSLTCSEDKIALSNFNLGETQWLQQFWNLN